MEQSYDFGGRLGRKKEEERSWDNLVDLPNTHLAFVYQRLSSHEQVKKHIYSVKAQDNLLDLARGDGYPDELIHVERRDLGISGTKGREGREGLAYLVEQIEASQVEAIYVVHISRLFRDQTLIDAFAFGELCKEHGAIIITPQMRLNLRDKMHMRIYRMEVERAADELDIMRMRLGGARELKARQGYYTGGSMPIGYVLNTAKTLRRNGRGVDNPDYHKYMPYEPHAEVVRTIFKMLRNPSMTPPRVVRHCTRNDITFPPFPEGLTRVKANLVVWLHTENNPDGSWPVNLQMVRGIAENPAYVGWWIWKGELLSTDNHPPIVDEDTFWAVQERMNGRKNPMVRPKKDHPPLPLGGLLWCGLHDPPHRMIYSSHNCGSYQDRKAEYGTDCSFIKSEYLDKPICDAVISQCSCPELVDEVISHLVEEYGQAKEQAASYKREFGRLRKEVETLEQNFALETLTPERALWIEGQIQEKLGRIKELSKIESRPAGKVFGNAVTEDDIELVREFLTDLNSHWESQPNDLKNAFLRLVLEKVVIRPERETIPARIYWRTGLEQEMLIHLPLFHRNRLWSEEEVSIIREHFGTTVRSELLPLLPNRTWRQILRKGKRLGLERPKSLEERVRKGLYGPEEDAVICQYYNSEISLSEMLTRLNRTEWSIRRRAAYLGLKKKYRDATWEWVETNFLTNGSPSNLE
ncbi:MAG: recombinase family protein [Anaerolineales bacterium]|nr:recombinase family protein [Anaerolineales bacterium]